MNVFSAYCLLMYEGCPENIQKNRGMPGWTFFPDSPCICLIHWKTQWMKQTHLSSLYKWRRHHLMTYLNSSISQKILERLKFPSDLKSYFVLCWLIIGFTLNLGPGHMLTRVQRQPELSLQFSQSLGIRPPVLFFFFFFGWTKYICLLSLGILLPPERLG